jgi:hypothetical protein
MHSRSLFLTLAGLVALAPVPGWATPLDVFRWKARVLVVSAPSAADPRLATQIQWLHAREPGLRERDLVIVTLVGQKVEGRGHLDARPLRSATQLPADRFGVALIGKDGSEALRQSEPIKMEELFQTIDAMPMRRDEMARRKP